MSNKKLQKVQNAAARITQRMPRNAHTTLRSTQIHPILGFSPFELIFRHTVRGPLKQLKEKFL